jgi:hypothetical protein
VNHHAVPHIQVRQLGRSLILAECGFRNDGHRYQFIRGSFYGDGVSGDARHGAYYMLLISMSECSGSKKCKANNENRKAGFHTSSIAIILRASAAPVSAGVSAPARPMLRWL